MQKAKLRLDLRQTKTRRHLLSEHHFRPSDLKSGGTERGGAHKRRRRNRTWQAEGHLCGDSSNGGSLVQQRQSIDGVPAEQLEWVVPDRPKEAIVGEGLRTRTLPERAVDGRQLALQTTVARAASASARAPAAAARIAELADAQAAAAVAAVAEAPRHNGQVVDVAALQAQLAEARRQLVERDAEPPHSGARLARDERLQRGIREQTGLRSYAAFTGLAALFKCYYPNGPRQYRGMSSIPDDVFAAALKQNCKRGTAAPAAGLSFVNDEDDESNSDDEAESPVVRSPVTGRHGSGICSDEEQEGSDGEGEGGGWEYE